MLPAALSLNVAASAVVFTGRGLFRGFAAYESGGSTDLLVKVYDAGSTSDTTKPLVPGFVVTKGTGTVQSLGAMVAAVERGITVVISGGTGIVTVFHNPETRLLTEMAVFDDGTTDLTEYGLLRWLQEMESA